MKLTRRKRLGALLVLVAPLLPCVLPPRPGELQSEERCKIAKLSDPAPGSIKLDVVCESADREGRPYKEIILLKKIDEKTIFIRETQDGKFKRPGGRMAYCPDKLQRSYKENHRKS